MSESESPNSAAQPSWTPPSAGGEAAVPEWVIPGSTPPPPPAPGFASAAQAAPSPQLSANSWRPGIIPLNPLQFGQFLEGGFKAIRHNPAVMVGIPALILLATQIIASAAMWQIFGNPALFDPYSTGYGEIDSADIAGMGVGLLIASLALGLSSTFITAFLTVSVARSILGHKITASEAWERTKGRLGHVLLYSVLTLVAGIILYAALIGLGVGIYNGAGGGILGLYIFFVVVAFLVVGSLVAVRILLVVPVIVLERFAPIAAIKRSWKLTVGRFWPILGIYLVATIIVSVIGQIFSFPLGIVSAFVTTSNPDSLALSQNITYGLSMFLGSLVTLPFMSAITTLVYTDQRMRKEGFDLQLAQAVQAQ